jgi:large subunit ribosomal protein L47
MHLMSSSLRTRALTAFRALGKVRRYSTPIDVTIPEAGETSGAPGALRPHLNVSVNPNHGLYAFFRKKEKDGKVTHDPLEDDSGLQDIFGEWTITNKIRRASFFDDGGIFFQAELGLRPSSEGKASGIFTPCGMSF